MTAKRLRLVASEMWLATSLGACTGPIAALHPTLTPAVASLCAASTACPDTVAVTFLGVNGFLLRYGTTAVMTAPLFTHHGALTTVLGYPYRSDPAVIDAALLRLGVRLGDVSTVLVGHSHYDHLLDVPSIARRYLRDDARIVGTPSMGRILAGDSAAARHALVVPAADAGNATHAGKWIYAADGKSRVMALESSHAKNFLFYTLAPGTVRKNYDTLPGTALGWKLGEVYAYIVDFIRADSTPVFRVFFQDAVSRPEHNALPPFQGRDVHAVNLEFVVAGNFNMAKDYPTTALANLRPDRVIVGHWDDFFEPWGDEPKVVPTLNTEELERRLDAYVRGRWVTPMPGAVMKFAFQAAR